MDNVSHSEFFLSGCMSLRSVRMHEAGSAHRVIDFDLGPKVCIGRGVQQHVPRSVLHAAERYNLGLQQV